MIRLICAILVMFTLMSCTKTLYTHQEVLNRYRTKGNVIANFGLPTEKREDGGLTEFVYNYGDVSVGSGYARGQANTTVTGGYNSIQANTTANAFGMSRVTNYTKYVKFLFDADGRTMRWESVGVDLAEKKKATGRTIIYVLAVLAAGVALGSVAAGN